MLAGFHVVAVGGVGIDPGTQYLALIPRCIAVRMWLALSRRSSSNILRYVLGPNARPSSGAWVFWVQGLIPNISSLIKMLRHLTDGVPRREIPARKS